MTVSIRESVEADIAALKDRLREADEKEVIAAGNENGEDALRQSFSRSTLRFTVDIDGHPVAMFGIVPESLVGESANVWFLGAPEMSKIKKTFVKLSRKIIADFLVFYPVLWNDVDARYVSSIRWLKSCGANFFETPVNRGGFDFMRFVIRRA